MSTKNYELQYFGFTAIPATYRLFGGSEQRELKWTIVIDKEELQLTQVINLDDSESLIGRLFDAAQCSFEQAIKKKREYERDRLVLDADALAKAIQAMVSKHHD